MATPAFRPKASEPHPQDPVCLPNLRARVRPKGDAELMAEYDVLEHQVAPGSERTDDGVKEQQEESEHPGRYHRRRSTATASEFRSTFAALQPKPEDTIIRELESTPPINTYFVLVGGVRADVVVATRLGRKYLKTRPDGESPDNLLSLPDCR